MRRSLTVSAPACFDYLADRSYLQRLAHQLLARIQSRAIIPVIKAFPLNRAAEAHQFLESRQNMGAVVLLP
jgi:NADPH:quinone reductase-like Zn-dependent oxidoreductase